MPAAEHPPAATRKVARIDPHNGHGSKRQRTLSDIFPFCDRAVDDSPPAPGCSPDRFGVAGSPTRTLAAVHAGEFGSAGGCRSEFALKRVFVLDGACIPHDL
jgi:hypothetical protein